MKKVVCISGTAAVLFLSLLLTGWADADSVLNSALRRGNEHYSSAEYEDALASYETGLEADGENGTLNFNAAQAAYLLGNFEKAAQYYEMAEDCVDKYLNAGNIFFRAGDAAPDANQKAQCYAQALQIYEEGIIKYPQDVPLKYNYETVKALADKLLEEMEQESEGEGGEQSEGESGEGQGENQSEESQDGQEQESEDAENAQGEQDQGSEQDGESAEAQDEGQEGDDQEAYPQNEGEDEYDPDQEAIARILEMLESQEQESLKNNQGVAPGKDDTNGW